MIGEKISNFLRNIVRVMGIIPVGYLFLQGLFTICCIERVTERLYFMENNPFSQLLGIVLFVCVVRLLLWERIQKFLMRYGNVLFIGALVLMIGFLAFWISQTRFWYYGDSELVYVAVQNLLEGNYIDWQPGGYFYMYPHQNGLALFVAFLLKHMSLGESFTAFYAVNLFFYGVTLVSVYASLRMLFREKSVCSVQGILMVCYFPYGFYCTLLYGNVIGFGWACASMALLLWYLKCGRIKWIVCSGICMALAIIFKQNEMIFFVGLIILLVFDFIHRIRERKKAVLCIAVYVLIVLAGVRTPDMILYQITGLEMDGGNSKLAWLAMGLQESDGVPGWYNGYNVDTFIQSGYDRETAAEISVASIRESLKEYLAEPEKGWRFFNRKLASEWNNPTFECFHIQNFRSTAAELSGPVKSVINDGGKLNILLIYGLDIGQSVLLFGTLLYLITAKEADWGQLLFVVLFIGGFLFFAFWEADSQYVLPFFFLLIPYSILGYMELMRNGKVRISFRKSNAKMRKKPLYIQGWNRLHTAVAVLALLIVITGISDNPWIRNSIKLNEDTEAYYEYIHQYNHNFMNLRF